MAIAVPFWKLRPPPTGRIELFRPDPLLGWSLKRAWDGTLALPGFRINTGNGADRQRLHLERRRLALAPHVVALLLHPELQVTARF